ncbi:MAG TPA: type II secretion system secretin GspD [Kofleriaceae bacterium]|nr:type II secretion system secretin GspD [Kofleriaceae bacterium]
MILCVSWFAISLVGGARGARADPGERPAAAETAASAETEPLFRCKSHPGPVVVTFKADTELKDLITWVMGFTCKNVLMDPRLSATSRRVSLVTPSAMSPEDAYQVFLAALATINLTVVARGNTLRIVDANAAHKEVPPLLHTGTPGETDQYVRYVYKPSFVTAEQLHTACQAMKSDAGDVFTFGQVLVITDYAGHVREMLAFARLVDVPGASDAIYTLPVHHADVTKLAEKLTAILNLAPGQAPPRPATPEAGKADPAKPGVAAVPSKLVVDERTNTLIIASAEPGYQRVKALVERLDVALEMEGGSAVHVYPLRSAIAEELAKTLSQAIGDGRAARPASGPGATTSGSAPGSKPGSTPGSTTSSAPSRLGVTPAPAAPQTAAAALPGPAIDSLGATIEGQVRVVPDPETNSLIVTANARDFAAVKDVIQQLDQPRRQISLEVVILEVEAGNDRTLGTSWHGGQTVGNDADPQNSSVLFGGVKTQDVNTLDVLSSLQAATGGFAGLVGPTLTLLGQSIPSYGVLFQAIAEQTHSNVVSTQTITAVDNVLAKFKVGSKRPVNMGNTITPFGSTTVSTPRIEFPEFPLQLTLKPHISGDDSVLLEVAQDAEELVSLTAQGPITNTRSLDTRVVVHDQETVVLSGLSQDRESTDTTKVPLLGDLPLLGYLFRTTKTTKLKTNLLVMLTPYIIKDRRDFQAFRERKQREYDEFARSVTSLAHMAYEPTIDYGRKRGVIEEINRAVLDAERDAAERAALTAAPRGVAAGLVDPAPAP